ncbi:NOP56 protein, partial [Polypterus senegalus]
MLQRSATCGIMEGTVDGSTVPWLSHLFWSGFRVFCTDFDCSFVGEYVVRTYEPAAARHKVLLHVLFEHAAGYALFVVKEAEEIGMLLPQVEESVLSVGKFNTIVQLTAFSPFKSAQSALENINAISEGIIHADLKLFLETNIPPSGKKRKVVLGVADGKIGAAVQEELGVSCQTGGVVAEILRGIRLHFHSLVKGLTAQSASKAQLGLGHSYSRAKVKFNVNRADNMIIQSIALLDQLDKDINTFAMRVREWYGYHFPELIKIISDNYTYCCLAKLIGNRKELSSESLEALEEVVMDSAKAQAILEASKSSMGMDISPIDLINIESFSSRVISLAEYRKGLQEYLRSKMSQVAPNLAALIGEVVGARLISHAGSLTNLAKYPASTVQILGAEKALFRYNCKVVVMMADNWVLLEIPTSVFGDKLREQVEERLSFYETGEAPRKNIDVMKEAVAEASWSSGDLLEVTAELKRKIEKKEKKKKKKEKRRLEALATAEEEEKEMKAQSNGEASHLCLSVSFNENDEAEVVKKKKKRSISDVSENGVSEIPPTKKKKKSKEVMQEEAEELPSIVPEVTQSGKKKKKSKVMEDE